MGRYSPAPVYLCNGWVTGLLYDLGHCPALVLDETAGPVWGEVFELDTALFEALDRYEAGCGDFHLRHAPVQTPHGPEVMAVYEIGAKEKLPAHHLPGGRWPAVGGFETASMTALGDQAVLVTFQGYDQLPALEVAGSFASALRYAAHPAVIDVVEAPASVAVHYRPQLLAPLGGAPHAQMVRFLMTLRAAREKHSVRSHVVPVCYAGELAPDLAALAGASGISMETLVNLHGSGTYTVVSLGFLPGFAYMAGLPKELHVPRLAAPRTHVPAGSIAIAGDLCGVYPEASPGGWRLVGRTPLKLFDATRAAPSFFSPGDKVRFRPISMDEFNAAHDA